MPAEPVARRERRGVSRLSMDGGKTIQDFLRAGLIDDLVTPQIPVLLGDGIPLYGAWSREVTLKIKSSSVLSGVAVQTVWPVAPA